MINKIRSWGFNKKTQTKVLLEHTFFVTHSMANGEGGRNFHKQISDKEDSWRYANIWNYPAFQSIYNN